MGESRPRYVGTLLIAEILALAATLTVVDGAMTDRIAVVAAVIALTMATVGQGSRRRLRAVVRRLYRARSALNILVARDDALVDRHGMVAVVALARGDKLLTTAYTAVPDPRSWPPMTVEGGPATRVQVLVHTVAPNRRVLLAVRVGGDGITWTPEALRGALKAAVAKVERRLDREGVGHQRLPVAALQGLLPANGAVREARDRLMVGRTHQITLRVTLPPEGMTSDLVVRLAASPDASTWLTWHGRVATMRVVAASATLAHRVAARIETTGDVTRMDGEHLACFRETLPIAWPTSINRGGGTPHAGTRKDKGIGAVPRQIDARLRLPPAGVPIGQDRHGDTVYLTIPPERTEPVRITIVGGDHAVRLLTERATTAGFSVRNGPRTASVTTGRSVPVPIVISVVDLPTAADAAALRDADIVVCQPLSAEAAAAVSGAFGLSGRSADWLTRIDSGMVALIGEGAVRWAMLTATPGAHEGLAGTRRT